MRLCLLLLFFVILGFGGAAFAQLPAMPFVDGPNCWNASLKAVGILPHYRYASAREIHFYSKSPLCSFVSYEDRQAGDIGLIRGEQLSGPGEVHSFVLTERDRAYSKNGLKKTTPYVNWSLAEVLALYGAPPLPLHFMRCSSLEQYLQNHSVPGFYLQTLNEITSYEADLEKYLMNGQEMGEAREREIFSLSQNYLNALTAYAHETSQMNPEERAFIQGVIRERFLSLAGQFSHANKAYLLIDLGVIFGKLP